MSWLDPGHHTPSVAPTSSSITTHTAGGRTYRDHVTRFAIDPQTLLQLARHEAPPHPDHQLVAPNSLRSRALELLLHELRGGELDEDEALQVHERLTALKVRLLGDRVSRRVAWTYARRFDWPDLADAEVLAVTKLQADALVTIDPQLRAKAEGEVPLAAFDDLFTAGTSSPAPPPA